MIVTCPMCSSKYSVQSESIGSGKVVRCSVCGMTWQQAAVDDGFGGGRRRALNLAKWTLFWFCVLAPVFSVFFAKNAVARVWPAIGDFYEAVGVPTDFHRKAIVIQNVSNFFSHKNGRLYMGLRGELLNVSGEVLALPGIVISLQDDVATVEKQPGTRYRRIWTHNLMYKKLLPNQKVAFETELQSVPYNNLICDIKLDTP